MTGLVAEAATSASRTACCTVGGGPGGMMLGLLLARRGVHVTVLEAHATFDRDFRGDTIHPGILEILDEIGLADRLHERPHVKMYGPALPDMDGGSGAPTLIFDFRELLKTRFPYIMLMPQSDFLDFLAEEAQKLPTFRLIMGASVHQLIEDDRSVSGVVYRMADQLHEIRAGLTVGADGRFSRVRKLAGFTPIPTSSPVELLWFRLPRLAGDPPGTGLIAPRFGAGHVLLTIDRADHWQVGLFFASGRYHELREAGVEAMRRTIVALEPRFAENVNALTEWQQFSLLSVASSRCPRWYKPGLLLIGDAAHTMSPAAGAGIKYAIEDAVVAARLLGADLLVDRVNTETLEEVQRQREWPTRVIQALGALGLWQLGRLLRANRRPSVPRFARAVFAVRPLAKLIAHMIAFGAWRVRVGE